LHKWAHFRVKIVFFQKKLDVAGRLLVSQQLLIYPILLIECRALLIECRALLKENKSLLIECRASTRHNRPIPPFTQDLTPDPAVDMDGAPHARTSNTWKTDKHTTLLLPTQPHPTYSSPHPTVTPSTPQPHPPHSVKETFVPLCP